MVDLNVAIVSHSLKCNKISAECTYSGRVHEVEKKLKRAHKILLVSPLQKL